LSKKKKKIIIKRNCYKKKKGIAMALLFKKNEFFMCYLIQFLEDLFFIKII